MTRVSFLVGSPEKAAEGPSPHKIVLNSKAEVDEVKEEIVEISTTPDDEVVAAAVVTEESATAQEPKVKTTKTKRKLIANQSANQDASQNHKLTEYFAVRRSVRKPKTAILEEKQRHLEEIVQSGAEDGLQVGSLLVFLCVAHPV